MMNFDGLSMPLPQALAGALRRLAQLAHTSSWSQWAAQRLTPTQRRILELLASRRESLTLSAVARELGVTPATACDSVAALEAKGFVRKRRSEVDGRALALLLTSEGRHSVMQLASLPDPLQSAFESLSEPEQETLYRTTIKMIRGLQESGALPPSRMCVGCRHFEPFRDTDSAATPHYCHLIDAALGDRHLRIDCPEYEGSDAETQKSLWLRFEGRTEPVNGAAEMNGSAERPVERCPGVHRSGTNGTNGLNGAGGLNGAAGLNGSGGVIPAQDVGHPFES
jgi:DNA-binding MarR family transcriptional regulator